VKEFVCFSTTDVFVPVSQLSTRDLFYFLGNLKIKQDIFVLGFSSCSIIRTTSVMTSLFKIFGTKCSRKCKFLSIWGDFYEVNCGVAIGFLTHLFQKDV
jgi:hypothetical protein